MDLNELRDALREPESPDPALFDGLVDSLAREIGPRAWLRSLPGPWRTALLALGAFGVVALVASIRPRVDLESYPMGRMLLFAVLTGGLTAFMVPLLARPVHRPPARATPWALALALAVPVALAVLPAAHAVGPERALPFAHRALACFAFGTVTGLPALALAWAVERQDPQPLARALLAAATAGLAGNMVLQAHCPITTPLHLLVSHSVIGAVLVALVWLRLRRSGPVVPPR